jgi:type 1 glutamine amidotransferase
MIVTLAASLALIALTRTAGALAPSPERIADPEPIRTLLITGANNHNWKYTSRFHAETLEATGRFKVEIADDAQAALNDPNGLEHIQLFVLDYNGPRWGSTGEENFLKAVRENGAGVVIIHAANNAFVGWKEYEELCGLMWINGTTGHGQFHSFDVEYTYKDHPITLGLADMKAHPDELYHKLVNTQQVKFGILAQAMSATGLGGTGQREPMAITLALGNGRIFHTPLGHVWEGQHTQKYSIADPQFKILLARGAEWAATGEVTLSTEWKDVRAHNTLGAVCRGNGWRPLFDGVNATGLRAYNTQGWPKEGWSIEDGTIHHHAGRGGGDLVTTQEYENFEFSIEWKCQLGGNSGLMYRVKEVPGQATYTTGPEMQILDNEKHNDAKNPKTSAGGLYAMIACQHDVIRPAGEWNQFTIRVQGNNVQHWANGFKVVEYNLNSPEWDAMIAESKFKDWKEFGRMPKGRIAIQDHGDDVWYRNVKVREIK